MRDRLSETGARYVRTQEAARMLDLSARTLRSTAATALARPFASSAAASFI